MMRKNSYTAAIVFTALLAWLPSLSAQETLLDNLNESDAERTETGLITIREVQKRYWSGMGTNMGSMGLLGNTLQTYAFISNPAIRKQLTAETFLYMGRVSKEEKKRSSARNYYKSAMAQARESIEFQPTSKAYRILAEAAYKEKTNRILPRSRKKKLFIEEAIETALRLDSKNLEALLLAVQVNKTQPSVDELLKMEKERPLSKTEQFRIHTVLSEAYRTLGDKEEASRRKREAFSIFPKSRFLPRGKMAADSH